MDDRAKIALTNLFDGIQTSQIDPTDLAPFTTALKAGLSLATTPEEQYEAVKIAVFAVTPIYKFRHTRGPRAINSHFLSVKHLSGLSTILKRLTVLPRAIPGIRYNPDEESVLEEAQYGHPDANGCQALADMINRYANPGRLVLGFPHEIVWVTDLKAAVDSPFTTSGIPGLSKSLDANLLRNALGLIQIGPGPLYVFRSTQSLVDAGTISGLRPTALDGIDNPRFCQDETRLGVTPAASWGFTTRLKGIDEFAAGLPELITLDIPIAGNLICSYLGELNSSAPGTHPGYLSYLLSGRNFNDIKAHLGL